MVKAWCFQDQWAKKLKIMRCRFLHSIGEKLSNNRLLMPQTSLSCKAVYQRLYQSADHSQVVVDATRLLLEVARWRTSWRLLLASCRSNPYLKARHYGIQRVYTWLGCLMCRCYRSIWVSDLVLQSQCCCKVQARLKWKRKGQFAMPPVPILNTRKFLFFLGYRLIKTGFELTH